MSFDFDTILDRRAFHSAKWCAYGPDVLPLPVADMDFATAPTIQEALARLVSHGALGYPCHPPHMAESIVAFLEAGHSWSPPPESITFLPGVLAGVRAALEAFSREGEPFVALTPVYPPLFEIGRQMGRVARLVPLMCDDEGHYSVDLDHLEFALPGARMLLLCSPHNPVGRVFSCDELERIAALCLEHEVLLVSDEIHADLVLGPQTHMPVGSLDPRIARHSITLMAPSKTFNIAGLGFGFAVTENTALRAQLRRAASRAGCGVSLPAWVAAKAAYEEPDALAWLTALREYLRANMTYLRSTLARELPSIIMSPSEGTFLAWLNCRALRLGNEPGSFFLRQARVALSEGSMFGPGGEGHVRLNVGCPRQTLREALDRMSQAVRRTL